LAFVACFRVNFTFTLLLTKEYPDDQIENEMGGACNTYRGEERCMQRFGGKT
jgi:hypothetical protein